MIVGTLVSACSGGSPSKGQSAGTTLPPRTSLAAPTTTAPPVSTTTIPPARTTTHAVPASITHDCSSDVAAELSSWIESVPDDSVLTFSPGGCYRVDETLVLKNRHNLVIDGKGATLRPMTTGDRTRQELVLRGGNSLTIRNLTVRGANPTAGAIEGAYHRNLEAQHAFQVSGATDVLIENVQAYDVYGDFVYVGPDGDQPSRNVTITHSKFERSGRQGISITDAESVTISANTIGGVAMCLFDIEPNYASQVARSIRIVGNVTGSAHNFWLADKGAHTNIGDIQISGNRMTASTGGLIFVYASGGPFRGPFLIEDNQFIAGDRVHDEHSSGAMFFGHAQDVTIQRNTVRFPKGTQMPAVEVRGSRRVRVNGNTFTGAAQNLLATQGSSDLHVN